MGHGLNSCLESFVWEVRQQSRNDHQKSGDPIENTRSSSLEKNHVRSCGDCWWNVAISQQEYVPGGNAAPNEEMMDPSEVVDGYSQLTVDSPYNTSIHGDSEDLKVSYSTVSPERLFNHHIGGTEENYNRTAYPIGHPAKYTAPTEEDILRSFLI